MIGNVLLFLVTWLVTWALLMVVYFGLLAAVDHLRAGWRRCQRVRQYRHAVAAERMRIDRETVASVARMGTAFLVAQQLVRNEAANQRERRS